MIYTPVMSVVTTILPTKTYKLIIMKIRIDQVIGQIYLLPYVKITHDKWLNGKYEFIIGWFNYELVLQTK
jgi:hypothetical protein